MSCGHYHGAFSHFRGPNRRKNPIPKSRVELCLLFEGCIRYSTLWQLVQEKKIVFPDEGPAVQVEGDEQVEEGEEEAVDEKTATDEKKEVAKRMLSMNDVISHMVVLTPVSKDVINNKLKNCINVLKDDLEAIERVAREISEDAGDNGVKYFEVGLDPTKFVTNTQEESLTFTDVVKAALKGMKEAEAYTGAKGSVILQCERGKTEDSRGILTLCQNLKADGVVGIELTCNDSVVNTVVAEDAGSVESLLFSTEDISLMAEAKEQKIHRSIQAGEYGPSDMIFQAIEKLHADRIVFGYSVAQDPSLYHDCKTNKIHFLFTPSLSILNTSVPATTFYHPVVQFAEEEMEFSISSGLPVITGGWTVQEFDLAQSWGLTETQLASSTFSAARASFLNDQDKKDLMKELRKIFGIEDKVELEIFINHKCGQPDDPRKVLKTSF
jgi:adenosine deaminase